MSMLGPMMSGLSQQLNANNNNNNNNTEGGDNSSSDDEEGELDLGSLVQQALGSIDINAIMSGMMSGSSGAAAGNGRRRRRADTTGERNNTTSSENNNNNNTQQQQQQTRQEQQQQQQIVRYNNEDELPTLFTLLTTAIQQEPTIIPRLLPVLQQMLMNSGNGIENINFDTTIFDNLRPTLQRQLNQALSNMSLFYRHHPENQTPLHTTVYPLFERDIDYSTELSILTDRTVEPLLTSFISTTTLRNALLQTTNDNMNDNNNVDENNLLYPITTDIASLINQLQEDDGIAEEDRLSLNATEAKIDKYLVLALTNMFGPVLTELVSYIIGLIRYGANINNNNNTDNNNNNNNFINYLNNIIIRFYYTNYNIDYYGHKKNNNNTNLLLIQKVLGNYNISHYY
eukprot:UN01134